MRRSGPFLVSVLFLGFAGLASAAAPPRPTVASVIDTTLATSSGQIRQFAFDGKPDTYFASTKHITRDDHFTLVFDRAVKVRSVQVTTGRPKGGDELDSAALEVSKDGKAFEQLATFTAGKASGKPENGAIRAVRIKAAADLKYPLVVREIVIDSEPAVKTFKHPVEFILDVSDAPEMKEWAEKAARACERHYDMINDELHSDSFTPRTTIHMTLKKDYKGVAAVAGGRIIGSVNYFKKRPDDIGAMIHETVHCVQAYRTRNNPGWLVEGIADYVRFFKYEPGKIGRLNPDRIRYNGSYRVTAAFLAYLTEKYDRDLVRKLNKAMREGEYNEAIFRALTKRTLKQLDEEWRASLRR
jgi:hypothetical protein